jgi:hypothetical protein
MQLINIAQAGAISDAPRLADAGAKILNFLLGIFGSIALLMVVYYGCMYFFAFGDKKKIVAAKNSIQAWTIGLILAMSSMIIVKFMGSFFN